MGTNHLSVGYESSQLWVRIVWVRNVRGYETSGKRGRCPPKSTQKPTRGPAPAHSQGPTQGPSAGPSAGPSEGPNPGGMNPMPVGTDPTPAGR